MAKVFVEGDHEALDRIAAALQSAGLSTVDIQFVARTREVTELPATPGNWAAFADLAPELTYADWRDEVLSLVDAETPAMLRNALSLCQSVTPSAA
jgi:hypothetical protein